MGEGANVAVAVSSVGEGGTGLYPQPYLRLAAVAPTLAALALQIGHSGDQQYRCPNYDGPNNDCAHAGEQIVHELCGLKADGVAEEAADAAANSEGGTRPIKRFPQAPFHPP